MLYSNQMPRKNQARSAIALRAFELLGIEVFIDVFADVFVDRLDRSGLQAFDGATH